VLAALRAAAMGMRAIPLSPAARNALALSSIQEVMLVSAGPPFDGLYLKPPLSGGLCEGVTTMPSARPEVRPRLYTRIAVRHGRGWREFATLGNHDLDSVGREHLQSALKGRQRQCVSINADKERTVDALCCAGTGRSPG